MCLKLKQIATEAASFGLFELQTQLFSRKIVNFGRFFSRPGWLDIPGSGLRRQTARTLLGGILRLSQFEEET